VVLNSAGEVIGKGGNERELKGDPTAHAEIIALRNAAEKIGSWRLEDCTLIVTLEPCAMCAGAILQSRIPRVVFGAWDEKAGAAGSLWDLLRDRRSLHQVEVISGVLEKRSQELLKKFFESVR
jgi:tRNA(adenine34) deaminase